MPIVENHVKMTSYVKLVVINFIHDGINFVLNNAARVNSIHSVTYGTSVRYLPNGDNNATLHMLPVHNKYITSSEITACVLHFCRAIACAKLY